MTPKGRTALVTGAAIRVGRGIARGLAADGARIVVHHHASVDEAEDLVQEIREGGGEAVAIRADLSRYDEVVQLADRAEAAFGGIDILVNSASIFPEAKLSEVDEALWDATLAINLKAPFFLTQRLGARMKARGAGVIVNMGDLSGLQGWPDHAAHAVSKAGLLHLTRIAARALAPQVRVNAIAPGTVLPPEKTDEAELRQLANRAPLRRIGSVDDVVSAVRYLVGADFMTGETVVVDGGRLLA